MKSKCIINHCYNDSFKKGYCQRHYQQYFKLNASISVKVSKPRTKKICSIEGCQNKHVARGYCNKHYQRVKKYDDPYYGDKPS